uniref:DUF4794 domain-containing protein n=1 Tax=Glossina brevipalpis TaxID=37001 RepID=A0A1A9X0L4_9MUSC
MFKLFLIALAWLCMTEAFVPSHHFTVPENSYANVAGDAGKASQGANPLTLSNSLYDENSVLSSASSNINDNVGASLSGGVRQQQTVSNPQSLSQSGTLARSSYLVSSSASASASAGGTGATTSALPSGSRTSATVQHRFLPPETVPLSLHVASRPGLRTVLVPETYTVQQPTVHKVGEVVQDIPTAVSHQRQTVVHKHARVVTPVVAPGVRTLTSHLVRAYHTPLVFGSQNPSVHYGKH